ncbi:chromosome partition protein Smc [Lachnospiraceae bacterium]|nr:chromosome partition protein Smc [Lachnospiraceae bacterium]
MKNGLTKEEVLRRVSANAGMEAAYQGMPGKWQERFLNFCTGKGGLPITYDPFFKKIFDPEIHPERLSRLLSLVLGKELKVHRALPNEGTRILDEGSLVIMDIVVEMGDGSIADVEIQKIPYLFPGERAACYSADLLMRQYLRVKGERGKKFSYRDIKKVYTVVLLEKSSEDFRTVPEAWIHKSRQKSDTGIELELLQEYVFIALDMFRKVSDNKRTGSELEAWMQMLSSSKPAVHAQIADKSLIFKGIYDEIEAFRQDIGGVLNMFSDALRILDRNTVQLMIDEMKEELEGTKEELEGTREELEGAKEELEGTKEELEEAKGKVEELAGQIGEQADQIKRQFSEMEEQAKALEEKQDELEKKDNRIKELEKMLKALEEN